MEKRKMQRKSKLWSRVAFLLVLMYLCGAALGSLAAKRGRKPEEQPLMIEESPTKLRTEKVVIDPGHGGFDPGKVGERGIPEKEINLQIALYLKEELEKCGICVILTRADDKALCGEEDEHKKVADMEKRIRIMEEEAPVLAISIHQNSYPQESVRGAQFFYYESSKEGEKLAESLRKAVAEKVAPENRRQIKANGNYYLLKKASVPTVIAECGFLSNREEEKLLCSEEYQRKMAQALCYGIIQYIECEELYPQGIVMELLG